MPKKRICYSVKTNAEPFIGVLLNSLKSAGTQQVYKNVMKLGALC